jgi:DNA-binding Xre family transcriptional regulator
MGKKRKKPKVNLEAVLKKKGVTKYKFAQMLGKHTSNVSVYFHEDYNPNFSTLVTWAEALDCKVSDFIEE